MTPHMFYNRCQCLRVIVIDEISMVPADLLGHLAKRLRKAKEHQFCSKRSEEESRRFGGVNLILCGDLAVATYRCYFSC